MARGRQEPTFRWCQPYDSTQGPLACALADAYGMAPHPWQRLVLDDWLALKPDGTLLNSTCLLPVPRQNGKTGVCDPRETLGLIVRGEWILHTAQEYQTSKKAFDRLREKFGTRKGDPHARFPELNALVRNYTTSANQMVLDLTTGGHIEFRTRGASSDVARGGTFDLVVVDEAQSYTDVQDAAIGPLNSAAPHGSPQTIFMGTVPGPEFAYKGEVFARLRRRAHERPDETCIAEWGATEVGDVSDVARWYEYNPSLGYQLLEGALRKDAASMTADVFAREHLGWWPEAGTFNAVIGTGDWDACAGEAPRETDGDVVCFAVKFSPDGSTGAIVACVLPPHGVPYVEGVEVQPLTVGLGWFCDWLMSRDGRCASVVVDGVGNGEALAERLRAEGMRKRKVVQPRSGDMSAACSELLSAVRERTFAHGEQQALRDSATKTERRSIGKLGGWGFQSTEHADATLIEACALALWGVKRAKRPGKEARVG